MWGDLGLDGLYHHGDFPLKCVASHSGQKPLIKLNYIQITEIHCDNKVPSIGLLSSCIEGNEYIGRLILPHKDLYIVSIHSSDKAGLSLLRSLLTLL